MTIGCQPRTLASRYRREWYLRFQSPHLTAVVESRGAAVISLPRLDGERSERRCLGSWCAVSIFSIAWRTNRPQDCQPGTGLKLDSSSRLVAHIDRNLGYRAVAGDSFAKCSTMTTSAPA